MPQMSFITDKNDTRDGEIFIKANYGTRVIDMTVFLQNEGSDLFEFKRWIGKKYQQLFEWDDDDEEKAIWAILSNKLESKVYYQKDFYARFDLSFTCHNPYYFINKKEEITFNNLVIGNSKNIRCAGNCDSYPLLKITPIGTQSVIQFKWNDLVVTLNNVDKDLYIDSEKNYCYEIINGIQVLATRKCNTNVWSDVPIIDCETTNSITVLQGNFNIVIDLRSRII